MSDRIEHDLIFTGAIGDAEQRVRVHCSCGWMSELAKPADAAQLGFEHQGAAISAAREKTS